MASSERVKQIVTAAADLSKDEREDLITALVLQLDAEGEPEAGYDDAWTAEIKKRVDAVLNGRSKGVPWSQVRDEIRSELRRRSA